MRSNYDGVGLSTMNMAGPYYYRKKERYNDKEAFKIEHTWYNMSRFRSYGIDPSYIQSKSTEHLHRM